MLLLLHHFTYKQVEQVMVKDILLQELLQLKQVIIVLILYLVFVIQISMKESESDTMVTSASDLLLQTLVLSNQFMLLVVVDMLLRLLILVFSLKTLILMLVILHSLLLIMHSIEILVLVLVEKVLIDGTFGMMLISLQMTF